VAPSRAAPFGGSIQDSEVPARPTAPARGTPSGRGDGAADSAASDREVAPEVVRRGLGVAFVLAALGHGDDA
jgi:hypothetical protein